MFGHKSLPSRVYSYGSKAPVEGADLVDAQMRGAHKYRNAIVEQELARRKRVDEALRRLSPELVETERRIAEEEGRLESAIDAINRVRAEDRKRTAPTPEMAAAVREARTALKDLRARRKTLRTALFTSPAWKEENGSVEAWNTGERKRVRAACGLYWGTYLHVEQSMAGARSGAPPKFLRWDGSGHLAVQLQGGLSPAEIFSCQDTRLRVEPVPPEAWEPGGRRLRRTRAWFRVGSDDSGSPVWTVLPIVLHRPVPEDAQIKWAHLIRRRIATQCEWRLQLVLSRESGWPMEDQAKDGAVGIDVGWRMRPDGSLRVAYWVGSDGREGELVLPGGPLKSGKDRDWLGEMRRVERIQSIRDGLMNDARAALSAALGALALPDWLKEAAATLPQWRSQGRLAALVISWRTARFAGDEATYAALEAWRKRDKHLYEFEGNLRDQIQRRREDIYRNFAAEIRRTYRTVVIEDLDLRDFHTLPKAEDEAEDGAVREHTRDACLSILIRCLTESMAETVRAPAENTTRLHFDCGSVEDWDRKKLIHTCSRCGRSYDQDRNAALNLLAKAATAPVV